MERKLHNCIVSCVHPSVNSSKSQKGTHEVYYLLSVRNFLQKRSRTKSADFSVAIGDKEQTQLNAGLQFKMWKLNGRAQNSPGFSFWCFLGRNARKPLLHKTCGQPL